MGTIVILTPEEAAAGKSIDPAQVEADLAQAELDMARAHADSAEAELHTADADGLPDDVLSKIRAEITAASAVVRDLEADSQAKGVPLSLAGSRYRIYNTGG